MNDGCSLCSLPLSKFPIVDGEVGFCCPGCQAVYHILASKQLLDNYQESIVFQQALRAGLISNPTLLEQIRTKNEQTDTLESEKLYLEIQEMWCPSCAEVIKLILLQEKGILNCVIDYATDLASIQFLPRYISKEKIKNLITSLGYVPHTLENRQNKKVSLNLYIRFGIAAFCALNAMMFAYPLYATYFDSNAQQEGTTFAWLTFFSSLPAMTYCMWPIVRRFFSSLMLGLLGMEALVMLGVFVAFFFSLYQLMHGSHQVYFDSMTVIIAFVLLGKIIESKAKFSAKESLFRLNQALPRRGRKIFPDKSTAYVPIKEILIDDRVVVYAGEKIILDGEIIDGEGTCDESHMTGEHRPIPKRIGSKLLGGSILLQGMITYKVLNTVEMSAVQKIIQAVELDLGVKSNYVRSADQIVRWFVPLVFLIALTTGLIGWILNEESALLRAISVLLIACPCAIGVAAPLAEFQILHKLAALGVIVRNRGCLAFLPKVTTVIFDKTGTITEGKFRLLDGYQSLLPTEKEILKALAKSSNHLICQAIFKAIESDIIALDHVEECAGKGMKGFVSNKIALLGSAQFFKENGISVEKSLSNDGSTVHFSPDGKKIYYLLLGDQIREGVPKMLKDLKQVLPLQTHTILLSGDSQSSVSSVSEKCRFDIYFSEVSPLQKRDFVEDYRKRGEIVCMLGDGINDAPALTLAHIGISVVSATDISIQVSDILLTTENLNVLPKILTIASLGQKILKQNLFWAFFYNCLGIGLAICGLLSPIFAAFAMSASSLIVLFNSRRIKYEKS